MPPVVLPVFGPREGLRRARNRSDRPREGGPNGIMDYYATLGVSKDATQDQIKSAYRKLARQYHPDVKPGDKGAEAKFKEVQNAYDVLGDAEKRKVYDQVGHAAYEAGARGGPPPGAGGWAARGAGGGAGPDFEFDLSELLKHASGGRGGHPGGAATSGEGFGSFFEDILTRMGGGAAGGGPKGKPRRSQRGSAPSVRDLETTLKVPFLTAVHGGPYSFDLESDGHSETISCALPPGAKSGDRLRVRGKGREGPGDSRGDLVVNLEVEPHPYFSRIEGTRDLQVEVPLTAAEAILGTKVDVPTLSGHKMLSIPAGTSGGQRLRVKGQGIPAYKDKPQGDLFVVVKVVVPKKVDDRSKELIREFAELNPMDPRAGLW